MDPRRQVCKPRSLAAEFLRAKQDLLNTSGPTERSFYDAPSLSGSSEPDNPPSVPSESPAAV